MASTRWKERYDRGRKYNTSWEEKFAWVTRASDGSENALCKLCKTQIAPKANRLTEHEKSKGHVSRVKAASGSRGLPEMFSPRGRENEEKKRVELELAVAVSCHCSTSSVDHLGELMRKNGKGSELQSIQLHRTKCTKLIHKVISPALFDELKNDVKSKKYCVLLDESTDLAVRKHLCVLIRYFSETQSKIVTAFVGLVPVVGATGSDLFLSLSGVLEKIGLTLSDCIGFASDGASAMIGEYNSVWSRVKQQSPNCQLNKCICHSLSLCVEKAFDKLPSSLGYLLHEIPKWFSKSIIRREAYRELFFTMDPNEERKGTPVPFQKISSTRWLVRGKVLYNILVNWEELQAYFPTALPVADASCRYKAREILNMLRDPINKLYFQFVTPVVTEFERVNSHFQATDADPEELVKELVLHHKTLKARLTDRMGGPLPKHRVDYGAKFTQELDAFLNSQNNSLEAVRKADDLKERCSNLLQEALDQVEKRLPVATEIFKGLSAFSPRKVLSQVERVPFAHLPLPHLRIGNEDLLEEQYRKVLHLTWREESVFSGEIPCDSVSFWCGVLQYKSSSGKRIFKELAEYVLACLTTPVSNAVVERIFSTVTNVKTKSRNRLQIDMLDAIIRIRSHLQFQGKCCKDFKVTNRMLELFNSANMYGTTDQTDETNDDEDVSEYFFT